MVEFYRRAMKKLDKLNSEQKRELLISAVDEINLLETVANSIDVGILVCDVNNTLIMANKWARRLIPINDSEDVLIWLAIRDVKIVEFLKESLLNREKVADREIDVMYHGMTKLLSVNVIPLVQNGKITGTLIYIDDITERRKEEARLRRAESHASLTTLAASVAHEIKNPLGSISIHLQLLQKVLKKKKLSSDSSIDKYFNIIKEEINRLNKIVVDFLFAVRPMTLELRKGNVNKVIKRMAEFVSEELHQSKIMCSLDLDEGLPEILMDERYMKQVILNLVKNAQAAMQKGGLLTICTKCIDKEIIIKICDTGTGISNENLSKIFDPYFTTKETGTGLGLTMVFKIIREHRGEMNVSSKPGKGSVFEIILPVPQKETRLIEYVDIKEKNRELPSSCN